MAYLRTLPRYFPVLALFFICTVLLLQPSPTSGVTNADPPYLIYGHVVPGDGTTPDFSVTPRSVTFDSQSALIQMDGSYETLRAFGDGQQVYGQTSAAGYLPEGIPGITVNGDTQHDFTIYAAKGWLSGAVYDAVTSGGLTGCCVTANGDGSNAVGNTYNFGGSPGYPAVGGGLSVSRSGGGTSGPGSTTYQVVATRSNYFSETVPELTLTSGQNVTGQDFHLYATKGNIKGSFLDAITGLAIGVGPTIKTVETGQSANRNASAGTYRSPARRAIRIGA